MDSCRPLVSICIPTCNSARYLRETLESIAVQTWPRLEVIIGDNASSDGTLAIADAYAVSHGWQVLRSDVNRGAFGNWNRLIETASGDYVALYHSDDVYLPTIVEDSVMLLERESAVGLVSTLATVIDGSGQERYAITLPLGVEPKRAYCFAEVFRAVLGCGGDRIFLVTPSVMVRRRLYAELGLFDMSGRFGSSGDYEMWLRIAARYPVAIIPRPLMRYRIHEGQGSETELRRNLAVPDIVAVLEQYAGLIDDPLLLGEYVRFLDKTYLKTALKQNCGGEYDRSSRTAGLIRPGRYWLPAVAIKLVNQLHCNLRYWPGRPWPCHLSLEEAP
jgi:glycosyltransferase involved in cell wall biosynthesis